MVTRSITRRPPPGFARSATTRETVGEGISRPRRIPLPRAPVFPTAHFGDFFSSRGDRIPCVSDAGVPYFLEYGRQAIFAALAGHGIGKGDCVLVPSYHCQAMIGPIVASGATPRFYRLTTNLDVDIDDFAEKCTGAAAALVVNYFGFANRLADIAELCRSHEIFFIEDCAHSYYGQSEGQSLGTFGDVAIASPRKFFPSAQGGLLVAPEDSGWPLATIRPGPAEELSAAIEMIRRSTRYGGFPALKPLIGLIDRRTSDPSPVDEWETSESAEIVISAKDLAPRRGFVCDRIIARNASGKEIANLRRRNYRRLESTLAELECAEPVFNQLPEGCVPYMFPIRISGLADIFPLLEDMALPMQRFGQFPSNLMATDTCRVATDLAEKGLQFPCHQGLDFDALDWISSCLAECANRVAKGNGR